jgi:hypothetical protein
MLSSYGFNNSKRMLISFWSTPAIYTMAQDSLTVSHLVTSMAKKYVVFRFFSRLDEADKSNTVQSILFSTPL